MSARRKTPDRQRAVENTSLPLHGHQRPAVADTVRTLTHHPRAQLIAACGSGKTVMGSVIARNVGRARTLVVVPTLELLWQTARTYRLQAGPGTAFVAVCSEHENAASCAEPAAVVDVTTSPTQLQALARAEPVVVLCTYASLPVLEQAHRDGMSRWDIMIIDEAHRSTGHRGKPWAAVHDDQRLPATRRLYLTATPRILGESSEDRPVASMDDETTFGPVAHTLTFAEAIRAGVLSDYRLVVPVISSRQLRHAFHARARHDAADLDHDLMTATQVATLRAARDYQLSRIVSFHSRLRSAKHMHESLLSTHADMIEDHRPTTVWSGYISGSHPPRYRQDLFDAFRHHDLDTAVLSNARVLAEGVDIDTIDGVVFSDPKTSVIDIVQAVGRALRRSDDDTKATVIVPVIHGTADTDESVLTSSAYEPVWHTLRALRAHDGRLDTDLSRIANEPRNQTVPQQLVVDTSLAATELSSHDLATGISVRTVGTKSLEWRRGYQAARRYRHTYGNLLVPGTYTDEYGINLGTWISWQRYLRRTNKLAAGRIAALDSLDMHWSPAEAAWQDTYAAARAYHAAHGHLAAPINETVGGIKLGQTLHNYRTRGVSTDRAQALAELDPWWNPPWRVAWQRQYYAAQTFYAEYGHAEIPRTYRSEDGHHLGEWLHSTQQNWDSLDLRQHELLQAIGIGPNRTSPHDQAWERGYAAAAAFVHAYGHLTPKTGYTTSDGYPLATWLTAQRSLLSKGRLSEQRRERLDELGMVWHTFNAEWWRKYALAQQFRDEHGHLDIPQAYHAADGTNIGAWLSGQRTNHNRGDLSEQRTDALEELGIRWNRPKGPARGG